MSPSRFSLYASLVLLMLAGVSFAQLGSTWVSLEDHVGPPDYAFGLNVSPDGQVYHVAVAGTFSSANRFVAVVDRLSRMVLARYPVGSYPEEIAYEVLPATPTQPPRVRKMFVTNSSSSSVSVLDSGGNALKTISLGTANYPYGIAMNPAGNLVGVTTKNDRIFLLDVPSLSVVRTLAVAGYHSRVAFLADGRMVFGSSVPVSGKTRVTATFMDPANPTGARVLELLPPSAGWPSIEDVALVNNGQEVWFPLMNADSTIRRVDTSTGVQVGSISLAGYFPSGKLHGIAASGEGLVIATSLGASENTVVLLKTAPAQVLTTLTLGIGQQPNDAVFTPDAREACVTMQFGLAGVHIVTGLPVPPFRLLASTLSPSRGGALQLTLRGAEGYSTSVIGLSITGNGPTQIVGYSFSLTLPIFPVWQGGHDIRGQAHPPAIQIPNQACLKGFRLYLQAFVQESGFKFRLSNPLTATIQ